MNDLTEMNDLRGEKSSLGCFDCGGDNTWSDSLPRGMIKKTLWKRAGLEPSDVVCQRCTEKRLGRKLTMKDHIGPRQLAISPECRMEGGKFIKMKRGDWKRYVKHLKVKR